MNRRCLYCYQPLDGHQYDFHTACSRKMFGHPLAPLLPYSDHHLEPLAAEVIRNSTAVTGVQPKLSLHIGAPDGDTLAQRFTIVGLWGGYILKPPSPIYPQLPELEDLTMHLASLARIPTAQHSLIPLQSGALAYITKRMDRGKKHKLHMEDMCQLTERLTEDKYRGSYEQIARAIQKYSAFPGLDTVNFYEQVLFSFLTGNADMHLKNFSLIESPASGMVLAPAYDLVPTALVNPADDEDMALTLNGKKKKFRRADFIAAFSNAHLEHRQQLNIFAKMEKSLPLWDECIAQSFVSDKLKDSYRALLRNRFDRIA